MKLVYSNFNKQTGESVVILQDKNGRYIGISTVQQNTIHITPNGLNINYQLELIIIQNIQKN